jgi:protein-S-isoprenylcysteine O-methyltransferase Ste14
MRDGFDLFQLFALGVFLTSFVARALVLRARGIRAITLARGKPPAQALLEAALVVALPIWVWEVAAYAWPAPLHVFPAAFGAVILQVPAARWLGALAIAAAVGTFALSLAAFGDSWRVGIDRDSPGALVTAGIFAHSRNPIFVAMDLYALGTFLVTGRLVFLIYAVATLAALHWQILQEERFLEAKYGSAYRRYRRSVPRYLCPRRMGLRPPEAGSRREVEPCD